MPFLKMNVTLYEKLLAQGGDIWSDLTHFLGPKAGILAKNSFEKSNAPHIPGITPSGLTLQVTVRQEINKKE